MAGVDDLEPDYSLPEGIVAHVVVETHVHKNTPSQSCEAWGILDGDLFILLWSSNKAVWDEAGYTGEPITLTQSELRSVSHMNEPDHVQTALAKFRLTGKVDPIC